ncbi:putative membrane protein YdfK [Sutcliffiella rhizosphaerae]|uniref:Membrane protein YdfK n=2 Tax=Sutcliffiella rhizosphaerae TaxID=2880967 RepID=A0ABN8ACD2_9BACI|nr:putative membrane protein YdfK [Sutcliffiella rhizosphaerae]
MKIIGLAVFLLGIQMGFKSNEFLIVIISLVVGAVIGEWINLDRILNNIGFWLEKKLGSNHGSVSKGFVTATLIFVIGAMAVVGSLDSGLRGDHQVLFTKSIIDGFTSIVLTTTLGIGVMFSAIPVMLYQGSIALFATQIDLFVPADLLELLIAEITATGGVMIMAIGINMTGISTIRVANLLPGILVAACLVVIQYFLLFD